MRLLKALFAVASLGAVLVLSVSPAHAANETITWGFSPTPTSVSIAVGETVTWNGNLVAHPVQVTNSTFTLAGTVVSAGGSSYMRQFSTPGTYYFRCSVHGASMPTTVTVTCPPPPATFAVLDVDANGVVDATTDGVLTLRYMLGLRGSALTAGALGNCATRDATAIETYLSTRIIP
jgi:plastocyanin